MSEFCKFCGTPLVEGKCENEHVFKKMCVNCGFCKENPNGEGLVCTNEENMNDAIEKMKAAAAEAAGGYSITNLSITVLPLPLKKPVAKCGKWVLDNAFLEEISNMFV